MSEGATRWICSAFGHAVVPDRECFGSIVQPFVRAMVNARAEFTNGDTVAARLIGHDDPWDAPVAHQLQHEALGCARISPVLHKDFENIAIAVNRPPEPVPLAPDGNDQFIKVPFVGRRRPVATDPCGDPGPKNEPQSIRISP